MRDGRGPVRAGREKEREREREKEKEGREETRSRVERDGAECVASRSARFLSIERYSAGNFSLTRVLLKLRRGTSSSSSSSSSWRALHGNFIGVVWGRAESGHCPGRDTGKRQR